MKRYGSRRGEGCTCTERFTCGVCCRQAPPYTYTLTDTAKKNTMRTTFDLPSKERDAVRALDPSLTPLCVSFIGMQETPTRMVGLYNIEEAIDNNLVLHSTVSLQTIAAYGYRPVMV